MKRKRKRYMLTREGHSCPSSGRTVTEPPGAKICESLITNLIDPSSLSCLPAVDVLQRSTISVTTRHRPLEQQWRPQRQRRGHICLHCNRFFTFLPFFLCHLRMRHRPIHCKKCCKYFVFRSVYIRHTLFVHGSRLRRKSSSMDSDVDSLASSTSSSKGGEIVAARKMSTSRLAWLYSPDTFDFVCPYCFYESFNEHDIRTHVYSCHWKNPHHVATKMSPALEALKQVGSNDSSCDRDTAENFRKTLDENERPSVLRRKNAFLKRSLVVERSPKITKISRKSSREENIHSKPSFSGEFLPRLPSAFDDDEKERVAYSFRDSDCVPRVVVSSHLSLPEKARTRASDDDVLGVDRRRSGDLIEIGDDNASSLTKPDSKMDGLNLTLPNGLVSPVIDDLNEKENRRRSLDLANIDQRVDFGSSEGMGCFLKEVIDFLSDGTEDVNDTSDDKSPSKCGNSSSPTSAEMKNDEIGVTRIRSKRIACQQQQGTAAKGDAPGSVSPKKIVEFVSLEDENEDKSSTALPLNFSSSATIKLEKKSNVSDSSSDAGPLSSARPKESGKKSTSDIQKMLLAYSCDSLGYLIVRPSQFITTGFSPASTPSRVSPHNPFAIPGMETEYDASLTVHKASIHDSFSGQVSSTKRKGKRKRRSNEAEDPGLMEMVSRISSCHLEDVAGARDDFDAEVRRASSPIAVQPVHRVQTVIEEGDSVGTRTLRKRILEHDATVENQHANDSKPSSADSTLKGTSKSQGLEVDAETCCSKPLTTSRTNRLRNEKQVVPNKLKPAMGGREKLDAVVKRAKSGSSQSLKENKSGTQQSEPDWYWPPKVNDMVVGLFEDGWYIGKALEITAKGDKVKIKFMEDRNFKVTQRFWKWPRINDVQVLVKCSILNVRPEVRLLDKAKGECTKNLAGGVYEVTNLAQIQARASEFYKKKRPTAPDVT